MRATLSLFLGATCLIALTALTGYSDAVDPLAIQEELAVPSGAINDVSIGQTLTVHRPRLHAIEVAWIVSSDFEFRRDAQIALHLRTLDDVREVATASLPISQIKNNSYSKFIFSPVLNSENQPYCFFLTLPRDAVTRGSLALWSSSEDSYPDGALLVNGAPTARDLAFRAYYEPDLGMLAGAFGDTLTRFGASGYVVLAILLFTSWLASRNSPKVFSIAVPLGTLLAFVVSIEQIRNLPVPLWVDSVTHAQYVQFILEQGRLPTDNFYHLGFHVLTALFAKISGLSVPQSLLLVGECLWVLSGLAAFVLSRRISGSAFAGLVAAVCVWFLSPTPAYFITWGRYPLILGSVILPISLVYAMDLIEPLRASARTILFAAMTFAALAFSQVRLAAFYVAFVMICLVISARAAKATKRVHLATLIGFVFLCGFMWLGLLFLNGVTWQHILAQNMQQPSIDLQTAIDVAVTHHGPELWLLAGLSAAVGIARRSRATFLMLGWLVALIAIALIPPVIGELVPESMIVLMAFLPASILVGDAAQWAYERLAAPHRFVRVAVWVATIVSVSLIGARDMVSIANPATILFTRSDESAMQWINTNVPSHSTFLVNSFNWTGNIFLPSDGGGWIPYLTNNSVEYLDVAASKSDSESKLFSWINSHNVKYIYLGTRPGVLQPSDLLLHPERFSEIYDRDGVRIFQVK